MYSAQYKDHYNADSCLYSPHNVHMNSLELGLNYLKIWSIKQAACFMLLNNKCFLIKYSWNFYHDFFTDFYIKNIFTYTWSISIKYYWMLISLNISLTIILLYLYYIIIQLHSTL